MPENPDFSTFYVLHGLLNGERGVYAQRSGGAHPDQSAMFDGHYYLLDHQVDPEEGPFDSREDAIDAAKTAIENRDRVQTWFFPLNDDDAPFRADEDMTPDECNIATITKSKNAAVFTCELDGSYETLTLTISCANHGTAARFYHALLRRASQLQ